MSSAENLKRYAQLVGSMVGSNPSAAFAFDLPHDIPSLVIHQQPCGSFFPENPVMHPEIWWFEELVILHRVANQAVITGDKTYQAAAKIAAEYHLREIQPDHATSDPWGLLAFIQYAPPLADQVLHAVRLNHPGGVDGTALLLLQDVLYGLRILMAEET